MATVVPRNQIERTVAACPQVERQMRAVAVGLEAEVRQTTFGRAVQTGELARSWRTVRVAPSTYVVGSTSKVAVFAEGGTGRPEQTRQGLRRVVRPKKAKALRFPAPPGWRVPVGSIVYAKYVKGWEPQHLLRDAGRAIGRRRGLSWRESANPINRATAQRDY